MNILRTKQNILLLCALIAVVLACTLHTSHAHAASNYQINYQGKLTSSTSAAVSDGAYNMVFKLYTAPTGGSPIWTENDTSTHHVQVTNGLFSVMLGSTTALSGVNFNQTLYLGVTVGSDSEMTPRKVLGAVPAAFESKNAQTLGGVASTSFLRSDQADTASGLLSFTGGLISNAASSTITNLTMLTATTTNLHVNGKLYGSNNSAGSNGMVLKSTGTGFQWVATSTLGFGTLSSTNIDTCSELASILSGQTTGSCGSVVLSASPTFTGTVGAGALTLSSDLTVGGASTFNATTTFNATADFGNEQVVLNSRALFDAAGNSSPFLYTDEPPFGGSGNTLFGPHALQYVWNDGLTADANNTAIGPYAGSELLSGGSNTILGSQAFGSAATGSRNIAIGVDAMGFSSEASENVAIGNYALLSNNGSGNIAIGYNIGDELFSGSNNILIGYDIDAPSDTASNILNIGNLIFGTGIDGTGTTTSSGNIGIGTSTPVSKLTVIGDIYNTGDARLADTALNVFTATGNVSIGSSSPSANFEEELSIDNSYTGSSDVLISMGLDASRYKLGIEASGNFVVENGTESSQYLNINSAGNIGIGTSTPGFRFVVDGASQFTDLIRASGNIQANEYRSGSGVPMLMRSTVGGATIIRAQEDDSIVFENLGGGIEYARFSSGDLGIGTSTPSQELTVAGDAYITGRIYDSSNSAGSNGYVLKSTGTGFQWVATSSLGIGGGATTFLGLSDTPSSYNTNRIPYETGSALTDSANFTYNGINLSVGSTNGYAIGGTTVVSASTTLGNYFFGAAGNATTKGFYNTGTGYQALLSNTTGSYNTANGKSSLTNNSTGTENTAYGSQTLYNNTIGSYNTANGADSLIANIRGSYNTALGYQTLYYATSSNDNTAIGYQSLFRNTSGHDSSATGYKSLASNTTGLYNTANGSYSLTSNTLGSYNTANGMQSLDFNISGSHNTANGFSALLSNTTGIENTAIGDSALYFNTTGSYNTVLGFQAGYDINTATSTGANTFIGHNTGRGITTGVNNTILGANVIGLSASLSNNIIIADGAGNRRINVDSSGKVGIGTSTPAKTLSVAGDVRVTGALYGSNNSAGSNGMVLKSTGTGFQWVATSSLGIGGGATTFLGLSDTPSSYNTNRIPYETGSALTDSANFTYDGTNLGVGANNGYAIGGVRILYSSTTNNSIGVGDGAGSALKGSAIYNVAVGYQALHFATSSVRNTAVGFQSLAPDTSGSENTALGYAVLGNNTKGSNNTGVGRSALVLNTIGNNNTAVGFNAAAYNNLASGTVAVGTNAAAGIASYSNQGGTYLGYNSGYSATTSSNYNTLLGYQAGYLVSSGANNIIIGAATSTASGITTGKNNILLGLGVRYGLSQTGSNQLNIGNLIFGTSVAGGNTLSSGKVGIGTTTPNQTLSVVGSINSYGNSAGYYIQGNQIIYASSTNNSIGVGNGAGSALKASATGNVAVGFQALHLATSSSVNTAVGLQSLYQNTSGTGNTALGFLSLTDNTKGKYNTGIGQNSLLRNTLGSNNTALGYLSAYNNTIASGTVAIGSNAAAGTSNYTNTGGVYLGYNSGYKAATSSDYNTLLGYQSGYDVTTGANNIVIGAATSTGNGITTGKNNILLGLGVRYGLSQTGSNQLNIGNLIFGTSVAGGNTLSSGKVGIGTSSPSQALTVAGSIRATGALYGSNNSAGSNGYVLKSTGTGFQWVATSTLGIGSTFTNSAQLAALLSDETGSAGGGVAVFSISPTFTGTPVLPSTFTIGANSLIRSGAHNLTLTTTATTNATIPSGTVTLYGTGAGTITSANLASSLSNETGSGSVVFGTAPTLSSTTISGILKLSSQTASRALFTDAQSRATTTAASSLLANSLTDETGSGSVVFSANPTFTGKVTLANATTTNFAIMGKLYDVTGSAGIKGKILQSTGTSTHWVATSSLGIGGGASTFLGLSDTPSSFNTGRVLFESGSAVTDSSAFTFANSRLTVPTFNASAASTTLISLNGVPFLKASSTNQSLSIGRFSGSALTASTLYNVAVGDYSLSDANTSYNTAFGYAAGYLSASSSTSDFLTAVGYNSGRENTGDNVTALGFQSGYQNHGIDGTFVGYGAGQSNTGGYSTIMGYGSGQGNTGSYLTAYGVQSGYLNTGSAVVALGYQAAVQNTSNALIAIGNEASRYRNSSSSIMIGYRAGYGSDLTRRSITNSTFVGDHAGFGITTGNNNLLLGYFVGDALSSGSNNIAIGYNIDLPSNTGSNQLDIGNLIFGTGIDGTNTTLSSGKIGIGTTSPSSKLDVWGNFRVGTSSAPTLFANTGNGQVGIGTSTPTSKLTIAGGNILQTAYGNPVLKGTYDTLGSSEGVYVSGTYAYVADFNSGLQIIDISNPASPVLVSTYDTPGQAEAVYVSGKYAYVADYGSIQIIDISNPTSPTFVGSYASGSAQGVYVSGRYAYVADNNPGLQIIDISNPASPSLVGTYNTSGTAQKVYVSGKYAYVADYTSGLQVIDISNPASPTLTGTYNTSGNAFGVYVSGKYAYVADASSGLEIINISNPASPTLTGTYNTSGSADDVYVSGKYAYVADDSAGLQVIDISNPASPSLVGTYNTSGTAIGVYVSGKYAYVADISSGLQVIDINGTEVPSLYAGNIETNDLNATENIIAENNIYAQNALNAGIGGVYSRGGIFSYVASSTVANPVSAAFMGGNVGIGTSTPAQKLTITGNVRLTGALYDSLNSAGSNGMVLQSTATGQKWVATSTLGIGGGSSLFTDGGSDTYLTSTGDNLLIGTTTNTSDNHKLVIRAADHQLALVNSSNNRWGFANWDSTNGLYFQYNNSNKMFLSSSGQLGIGTTSPQSLLTLGKDTGLTGSVIAGLKEHFTFTNSTASAVYYGDNTYIVNAPTATSTLVGKMLKIEDNTLLGNTVRGLEVQAHRGTNTQGENTGISGYGRTFGVRGTTEGDAGGLYQPAGIFAETRGTTQGNALRAYSSSITTEDLVSLFQDTSSFAGTGLVMNFGNSGGSFGSTTSKFIDLQNGGVTNFTVGAHGLTTIGDGTTNHNAGLQIGYGGLCVDNDGTCNASTTGKITSVSSAVGNSDLAEMYFSSDALVPGDIVYAAGALSIGKADDTTKQSVIGVVSTKPGLTLGFDDTSLDLGQRGYPVALSGRVPIRLSTENGSIKKGDKIALSSIPGVGMKATKTGTVVGIALEDYDGDRAYSEGFINQFGSDIAKKNTKPTTVSTDIHLNDGCYHGGGDELGAAPCTPNTTATTSVQTDTTATTSDEQDALFALAHEHADVMTAQDGKDVHVGEALMFVNLGWQQSVQETAGLAQLTSTSSDIVLNGDGHETLLSRLTSLAQGFVNGILSVLELHANKVVVKDEMCVDDVCVTADDLRALLRNAHQPEDGSGGGTQSDTQDDPLVTTPSVSSTSTTGTDSASSTASSTSSATNSTDIADDQSASSSDPLTVDQGATSPVSEDTVTDTPPEGTPPPADIPPSTTQFAPDISITDGNTP